MVFISIICRCFLTTATLILLVCKNDTVSGLCKVYMHDIRFNLNINGLRRMIERCRRWLKRSFYMNKITIERNVKWNAKTVQCTVHYTTYHWTLSSRIYCMFMNNNKHFVIQNYWISLKTIHLNAYITQDRSTKMRGVYYKKQQQGL